MMIPKLQFGVQCHPTSRSSSTGWMIQGGLLWLLSAALLTGCVSKEQYQAEKVRGLNFQRLLAQEERRVNALNTQVGEKDKQIKELNAQLEKTKQEITSMESQNRELISQNRGLTVELEVLREQHSRQPAKGPAVESPVLSTDLDASENRPLSEPSLSDPFMSEEQLMNILGSEGNADVPQAQ